MSWPPGYVLFSWDASSSPTPKARTPKQRQGHLANVGFVSEETPHPAFPCGKETVGQESQSCWMVLGKQRPNPSSSGCVHGVHAAPPKIHMGRCARSKAPYGLPMFSIHAYHAQPYQLQDRSHIDIGTAQKTPSPSPAPAAALLPPLPQPLLDAAVFRDPQSLDCV